ncbi:MAG: T9SS type A sorting domain-containing protein [Bacteroidota bacterium]
MLHAQAPRYVPLHDIEVAIDGKILQTALNGGLAMPQFSQLDLDGQGYEDLIVFDRIGDKLLPFINEGQQGDIQYRYAPEYEALFPTLGNFALMMDFNCDGLKDIFTTKKQSASEAELLFYQAGLRNGELYFEEAPYRNTTMNTPRIETHALDIPAFSDVNGDGDIDILQFPRVSNNIYYFENQSVERGYGCDSLIFELQDDCWGLLEYSLSGLQLEFCDGFQGGGLVRSACNGSTLLAYDFDDDSDQDMLYSSLTSFGISYLPNNGNTDGALIEEEQINFLFDSARVLSFPASFMLDVDNDNLLDIAVSSNRVADVLSGETRDRFYFFKNMASNEQPEFEFHNDHLLIDQVLDEGFRSSVAPLDYNVDGLVDLVIAGNYRHPYFGYTSRLNLYLNTGTPEQPRFVRIDEDLSGLFQYNFKTIHPTFGDVDGDGDQDLVIGTFKGDLHYFENVAPANQPADFRWRLDIFEGIDVGLSSRPQLVDFDRDGLLDVLVGSANGPIQYLRQTGSATAPTFELIDETLGGIYPDTFLVDSSPFLIKDPEDSTAFFLLNGTRDGRIEWYQNIVEGEEFERIDQAYGQIDVGSYATLSVADLNADGRPELLLGNERGGINIYSPEADQTTSVKQVPTASPFQLFPNPAHNYFNIYLNQHVNSSVSYELFNVLGQSVLAGEIPVGSAQTRVAINSLSSGTYWCKLYTEKQYFLHRLVIP